MTTGVNAVTVIALVAVNEPSAVVTVTAAVPDATAVTRPVAFTVAIVVSLDAHVTALLEALAGTTAAVSCCVAPTATLAEAGVTVTPVTEIAIPVTVIALVAVNEPSAVVTVIVASPGATAVTRPVALTVAIAVLLDAHVTALLEASAGIVAAVSCCVAPTATLAVGGDTVTPVTGIGATVSTIVTVSMKNSAVAAGLSKYNKNVVIGCVRIKSPSNLVKPAALASGVIS